MYSVNGVALDDASRGWALSASTRPLSEYTRDLASIPRAGRDGVVAGLASTADPVTIPIAVETTRAQRESLLAVFGSAGVLTPTGSSDREVAYEVASTSYRSLAAKADELVEELFMLRLPSVYWRAKTVATPSAAMSAASVVLPVFSGMSAPVQDAMVRVQGQAGGVQVTDASGAWVTLPDAAAGQWVRFESETGRCFRTTTDVWTGGTDVSGLVDFGGPRGVFEITPVVNPSTLARAGSLTVTSATRSGASISVRGKAAYLM